MRMIKAILKATLYVTLIFVLPLLLLVAATLAGGYFGVIGIVIFFAILFIVWIASLVYLEEDDKK